MLQIQQYNTLVPDPAQSQQLASRFAADHYVHLPQLLEFTLREAIAAMISEAAFEERVTPNIGCVECCADPKIDNGFNALLNQPEIRQSISQIVGQPIDLWAGSTVRRVPGKNHFSNWHNDNSPPIVTDDGRHFQRVVPLSLNVSEGKFSGGNLEIRTVPELNVIADIPNPVPGDALLFEISEMLQHRVADVTAGCPRVVHVGWFHRRIPNPNTS